MDKPSFKDVLNDTIKREQSKPQVRPAKRKMLGLKPPPTKRRPPAPPSGNIKSEAKKSERNETLLNSSNSYNQSVHEHIEKYGIDEELKAELRSKFNWIVWITDKYGI